MYNNIISTKIEKARELCAATYQNEVTSLVEEVQLCIQKLEEVEDFHQLSCAMHELEMAMSDLDWFAHN